MGKYRSPGFTIKNDLTRLTNPAFITFQRHSRTFGQVRYHHPGL